MKYRIRPSERPHERRMTKPLRRAGFDTFSKKRDVQNDPIEFTTLFEFAMLEGTVTPPGKRRRGGENRLAPFIKKIWASLKKGAAAVRRGASAFFGRISEKYKKYKAQKEARPKLPSMLPPLAGAFAASVAVALISALIVVYKLIISDYFGNYRVVHVPDVVGMKYSEVWGTLDSSDYDLGVIYEYSAEIPAGTVISQTPPGGVSRKIYKKDDVCTLGVVVSRGERVYTMDDYIGSSLRDAELELKNYGIAVRITESYSDTVRKGYIISTEPAENESFGERDTVVLNVSMGKQVVYATVPNICGVTEMQATSLLLSAGLLPGEVVYVRSEERTGTVISQNVSPYSELEYGSRVSFTVSAGIQYSERQVPSLYGLNVEDAERKLAEYGLVVGTVYYVSSGEPSGTVVSQSPCSGTSVSAELISVDLYVSYG